MNPSVPECTRCNRVYVPVRGAEAGTLCADCSSPESGPPFAQTGHRRRRRRRFYLSRAEGVENMQHGGVVFVLGSSVTFCTYAFADVFGGVFLVAWGAVAFGGIRFLYGLFQYFA